jgi:hypothetical protein
MASSEQSCVDSDDADLSADAWAAPTGARRPRPLQVSLGQQQLTGHWLLCADMVTVWHATHGSRTDLLKGRGPRAVAEALLIELLEPRLQVSKC